MDTNQIPYHFVSSISFSVYGLNELRKIAVLEITNPSTFDSMGHPSKGGLHDRMLGPTEFGEVCEACGLNCLNCPGHLGYITLPLPTFNPLFFRTLYAILKGCCLKCHHLLVAPWVIQLTLAQLQLLKLGVTGAVQELEDIASDAVNSAAGESSMGSKSHKNPLFLSMAVKDRLEAKLHEIKESVSLETGNHESTHVKNVVEFRQRLIRSFIRNHLSKGSGKCPHCGSVRVPISVHQNTRFIFGKNRGVKRKVETTLKAKIQKVRPEDTFDELVAAEEEEENALNITDDDRFQDQSYLTAQEAQQHLRNLWENEGPFLSQLFGVLSPINCTQDSGESPVDIFFMNALVVSPSRFRPLAVMKGRKYENPHTSNLNKVLQASQLLKEIITYMKTCPQETTVQSGGPGNDENSSTKLLLSKVQGQTLGEKLHFAWNSLQVAVNCVVDSDLDKLSTDKAPGVKQIIEKKEGLFRKHMMGKRVNYACRSVISPDPYIMVDEIGVPTIFATRLTYPQPVTPWNVRQLRQAVLNGPNKHPGALLVQNEDGSVVKLNANQPVQREAVAKQLLTPALSLGKQKLEGRPKIVYRHLQTGDVLLLNRQPTLHKPSIMAHKARVLHGEKTLRLHYANCKCYNADFDGDEMNAHFPQSELGRSEAYNLASVVNNYLVPKDGTPLSGLIQDHMVSGVLLSMRGRFFYREDYLNLVYGALAFINHPFKLLPPAMLKPKIMWSGKQVLSTVILNIIPEGRTPPSLQGKAKIGDKNWLREAPRPWLAGGTELVGDDMSESQVIIRNGELLCGVLDKAHYGPTPYGLIHCCYEFYGGHISSLLLTSLARLFTHFLQSHIGFTLGIQDILVTRSANKKRQKIMKNAQKVGNGAAAEALGVHNAEDLEDLQDKVEDAHRSLDDRPLKQMDMAMKSRTDDVNNSINKACIPNGLLRKFPENNLQLMVNSGAKGATVNCMQISCLLGQIELEGRRVPLMLSGKTLPSFLAYDTSPRAGGFIDGRFLTGIRPQEFFFHCMAGREGLVDTAVKTSRSGYLQRCLIKHLEGLVVNYDLTVRDSDGSIIQFQYGEDGLDILKSQLLKSSQFSLLVQNYKAVVDQKQLKHLQEVSGNEDTISHNQILYNWRQNQPGKTKPSRASGFIHFANEHGDVLQSFYQQDNSWNDCKNQLAQMWFALDDSERQRYRNQCYLCPDPLSSRLQSDVHFGVISEKLESLVQDYMEKNPHSLLKPTNYVNESHKKNKKKHCRESKYGIMRGTLPVDDFKNMIYFRAMKSLCEPGEAVGLLAAQSVGEPSTQMTLNTFHFAGRGEMNVTLGIPRMREILMTGSANLATPSMDLPLIDTCPDLEKRAEALKTLLTNVSMAQVLEKVDIKEKLIIQGKLRHRAFLLRFQFLPYNLYKSKYAVDPGKILTYTEHVFFKKLISAIKRKMATLLDTRLTSSQRIRPLVQRQNRENEDIVEPEVHIAEDEGASSDDGEGDGDTTDARSRQRHDQDREYEEKEEEDLEATGLAQEEEEELDEDDDDTIIKKEPLDEEEEEEEDGFESKTRSVTRAEMKLRKEQKEMLAQKRSEIVVASHQYINSYSFDIKKELWCELGLQLSVESGKLDLCSLIQEEAEKAVIHETSGIKKAFLVKDPNATDRVYDKMIKTDGVNFLEILKYDDLIDLNRITSNDIHAISKSYGIEAATRTIVKEVSGVFAAYGIEVDPRHLMLIADYMTFDGSFRGCNRMGMEVNASPLQQMTFETTMHFLRSATLAGYEDQLKSPSSCLVLGHVVKGGTGCHELFQPRTEVM